MRILVNQTTRMGDMLQTSPLIQEIRDQWPDAHITAMVRGMGKIIGERHPAVNEVIVYNEDDMFLDMRARDSERYLAAYRNADQRILQLKDAHYDLAFNVTHSIASAMMLKMAEIPKVVGAHLSDDWQFVLRGAWANYFFTSVFSREYNDLNLCDITRNFLPDAPPCRRLVFEVTGDDRAFVDALFEKHDIAPGEFVVCFQLGASELNKRWSDRRFAELGRLLADQYNARIFLLGVESEAPLGESFARHAPHLAIPLFGKTSVPQAAALLERAKLLVTNDTGTMHIAAAVGCRNVLVSVGHVHYRETGPYGEGHCAVEWRRRNIGRSDFVPGGEEERELILADHVLATIRLILDDDVSCPVQQIPVAPGLESVDFYMTRFAPDGFLQFYPILRRPMTERDFMRIAYRAMWLDYLGGGDRVQERAALERILSYYDGPDPAMLTAWQREHTRMFEGLAEMSQRGVKRTQALLETLQQKKGYDRAKRQVADLMALDEEARVYSEINPPCRPLILIARFERDNLEGADPLVLAKTTLDIYRACYQRAKLAAKKLETVSELWRTLWSGR